MSTHYPQSETTSVTPSSGSRSSDADKGMVEKASDAVRSAADQAGDLAERAIEHGRDAAGMVQNAPGAMREAVDTSLKERPMATLALAGALGFLLGAVWKS